MTGAELHAAVLAALGSAGYAIADSTGGPWHAGDSPGLRTDFVLSAGQGRRIADGLSRQDAHLIAALRNTAPAALRGARRIIERHTPAGADCCSACLGHLYAAAEWPCPDYRDAAAVIPNLPEEVARALRAA